VEETQETVRAGNDSVEAPPSRRRFPAKSALIAGALVIALLLLVVPVFFTLQPAYYERYPSLRVRMQNWATSTHARMSCPDCHVDPGFTGFVTFAAKSIPDFYSQLIYGPTATNLLSVPDSVACLKCHTTYRQVSPNGDLLIPHRAHVVVLQIRCAVCHKNLVHSLNSKGFNQPEMATCMTCHDGKQAVNQCVKCHTRKEVPPSHKAADWLSVHATKVTTIDCGQCHAFTPDYCRACHLQRPPSHVGNWKALHAGAATKQGTKGCYVCHDAKSFCGQCH